ncbi:hypothetical protein GGR58DRAFT_499800 [Xylaria digitata]|nr:hypothetical protein GGR58DRAFT_499800 [Xylaria digitata]
MPGNWSKTTREGGWEYSTNLSTDRMWTRESGQATQWRAVPPVNAPITHERRNREYYTDGSGVAWTRKVQSNGQRENWKPVVMSQVAAQRANNHLFLVRQHQSQGQPMHWLLAVAPENGEGTIYQVKGDAQNMRYQHISKANVFVSGSYADSRRICELDANGEIWVAYFTSQVTPPRAESQTQVRGDCQDWVVQVIQELEGKDVVPRGSAANFASWHDYDNNGARLFG